MSAMDVENGHLHRSINTNSECLEIGFCKGHFVELTFQENGEYCVIQNTKNSMLQMTS